ncbi:MAG: hypothetical protein HKN78_07025 [Sphingomonadaceae bacterium]|nr:hypothetical protein [Sphingomonadaceae bacterium]
MSIKTILTGLLCLAMIVWLYFAVTEISALSGDIEGMSAADPDADPLIMQTRMESVRSAQDARQMTIVYVVISFVVFAAALFGIRRIGRNKDPEG